MAKDTNIALRGNIIYSVFVRNHTREGTFAALEADLDRIKALGADIVWLLPIHPVGKVNRKGSLGSPYAIQNYREINPEFGTMADFKHLVDAIHARGMKCIIDVVYNHTSPDSWLAQNHPEWFYKKADGKMGNRTAEWTDVVDLDYTQPALWDYQIETLVQWAGIVDGFRCDVASLVPAAFWAKARAAVEKTCPGAIWLAESVHPGFIIENRHRGFTAHSDCELYDAAYDLCYDYDIRDYFDGYFAGTTPLARYAEAVMQQESIYPANYIKLRFLENHDQPRAAGMMPDEGVLKNWTVLLFLLKGTTLLYGGQEVCAQGTPSLFDRDVVNWGTGRDITPLLQTLCALKKEEIFINGNFTLQADEPAQLLLCRYEAEGEQLVGLISAKGGSGKMVVALPDGGYQNLLDGTPVQVQGGFLATNGQPIVIKSQG